MRRATAFTVLIRGCLGLSPAISPQFTLLLCVPCSRKSQKTLKFFIFVDQGHSRSLIPLKRHHQCLLW